MSKLFCFISLISLSFGALDTKISLNGDDWMVTNGSMKSIPATVPGEIYLPLVNAGILSKPYYDLNVMLDRWVAQTNWNYTKTFTIDSSTKLLDNDIVQIVFDGIDTNAHVYINGNYIFFNDNMFHKSIINIKNYLKYGDNTILVELFSKVNWASQTAHSCKASTDGQCPGCTSQDQGFTCVNYIRTEPCSFAWDWGPAYAPMGIWKGVYLQGYSTAVVRDFLIWTNPVNNTNIDKNKPMKQGSMTNDEYLIYKAYFNEYTDAIDYTQWNTQVVVYIDAGANNVLWPGNNSNIINTNANIAGIIQITIDGISQTFKKDVTITQGAEMNFTVDLGTLKNINTWMPNKFGKQTLYNFNVNFIVNSVSDIGKTKLFGFRKIELIQDPLPGGRSFYIRINGDNIPIHGSNWIPSYALDNSNYSVNTQSLEDIFIALYNSNQNMIRNWGGGIYQQTDFYNLADKYGILIWQDFMFACASYWDNPNWLKSVNKESHDFLRERQTTASIAVWAANNENGGDCHKGQESETSYRDLYWKNVLDVVAILDPTRPKVSSSPSNGNETEQEPCSFTSVYNPYYGDVHQYLYNQDCWNVGIYVKARFVSEFGWQSWPSFSTMSKYLSSDQYYYNSPVMQNRQHHPNGQSEMVTEIELHYNLPHQYYNATKPDEIGYRYMLYATQYSQAYCYKVEVEYFRSLRNTCSESTPGCTMGEMYWQTNDIWPGASWSGIDFDNRYKLVQYYSKHFYSKILVGGHYGGSNYTFYGINDYINEYQCVNCILEFNAWSFSDGPKNSWNVSNINIPYQSAVSNLWTQDYNTFTNTTGCVSLKYDCMLIMNLYDKNGTIMNTNFLLVGSQIMTTNSKDPKPTIISVNKNNNGDFDIQFSVDALAVFVFMETNVTGIFDDNGMVLTPGKYTNTFYTSESVTADQLKDSLYLYSLYEAGGFQNSPQFL